MQLYQTMVAAWQRIAETFDIAAYGALVREIGLEEFPAATEYILMGEINGRALVRPHQP